jgi:hypothetical protein
LRANLFTALRVPKPFLGFEEATGDGKNLALQDIRFSRTINRIQQSMLQELNKIAIIHLYILGFEEDLDNFTLTLNNPSTQAKMLEVENLQTKVTVYKDSVSDAGNGFGAMSMVRAKRKILEMSDDEIKEDLLEQRMEKAAAAELANTASVIKHTGMFDIVDRVGDLNDDVKVDLNLEYNGNVFAKTGVIKKELLPNLLSIREDMRKVSSKSGYYPVISIYIALIEGAEDNRELPCNYYLLITFNGSSAYNILNSKGLIKDNFTTKEQMPITEIERLELKQKQRDEERRLLSKKKATTFQLPSKVEPKKVEPTKVEPKVKDTKANRLAEYNKAMDKLDSQLERKLITKKQYNERFQQLGKNLKDGGEV